MARCPNCGSWIWRGPGLIFRQEVVCPDCGAILRLKDSLSGLLLGSLEVSGFEESARGGNRYIEERASSIQDLPPSVRKDFGDLGIGGNEEVDGEQTDESPAFHPRNKIEMDEAEPSFRGHKGQWGHCNHCHAIVMLSNSKFCSNCGASLGHRLEDTTPLGEEGRAKPKEHIEAMADHGEKCMVCDLGLAQDDNVVWCPHCGNPAHRIHLLEWIHVRDCCPVCGERLREQDFQ